MKITLFLIALIAILGMSILPLAAQVEAPPTNKSIEGVWQGKLSVSGIELRLVVKINKKPDGALAGTLDSIDQGAKDIPLDTVAFSNGTLRIELKSIGGVYEGTLNSAGTELTGTWTQGPNSLPLVLKRDAKLPEVRRPQEPKKPYPYNEEEVLYNNTQAGIKLGGTLTLPKDKGPFPAVLLITGSGQQNRNEELLSHKPFLVLADYLTRRGIAVLRVDDRGIGKSTGNFGASTTADFATDVLAGIAYLKTRPEIRHDQIGLIGHSEGGVIAPMVAAQSKDVAFIVLMAGTGVNGEEILLEQGALIAKAGGATDAAISTNQGLQRKIFAVLRSEKDPKQAEAKLKTAMQDELAKLPETQRKALSSDLDVQIKRVESPWMRYFLTYEPKSALMKVTCPVLALNGSKDLQVPPKQNLPAIVSALTAGGNSDVTIRLLPGLNHLFQTCKTGSPAEYAQIEETIAPVALQTMGDWILAHTPQK